MGTATAAATERSSRTSPLTHEDWSAVLRDLDPLAGWKDDFRQWIETLKEFRQMESVYFFKARKTEEARRVHRGWACSLVANGEKLAIDLLKIVADESEKKKQAGFLDAFLSTVQCTLLTWHAADAEEAAKTLKAA